MTAYVEVETRMLDPEQHEVHYISGAEHVYDPGLILRSVADLLDALTREDGSQVSLGALSVEWMPDEGYTATVAVGRQPVEDRRPSAKGDSGEPGGAP